VAGYVDAYGLLAYGTYVSFMSGNTTQAGSTIAHGKLFATLPCVIAILLFLTGAFLGTWLTHSNLRQSRRVLFALVAALLAVIIAGTELSNLSLHSDICIATLSLSMGLMNSALTRIGAEPVSLTFVTGTLNKIGFHLAMAFRRKPLTNAQGKWDTHLRRAGVMAGVWGGFVTGAFLSGAATIYLGAWVLLVPVLILLVLTVSPDKAPILPVLVNEREQMTVTLGKWSKENARVDEYSAQ
jgi:uncharacterized membrane protein YoaK (UPF0700 family)